MPRDFRQIDWDEQLEDDCRQIVRLAVREDLADQHDWTTIALTPESRMASARIVAREGGVAAGMPSLTTVVEEMQLNLEAAASLEDGEAFNPGDCLAKVSGNVRDLLTGERTMLNLLGRLIGVATLTSQFVQKVSGMKARVYDTRKTTPGWRRLEKYAVRCGGGHNHRTGLFDGILIKDNHLAQLQVEGEGTSPAVLAVQKVRQFLAALPATLSHGNCLIEIEVDRLDQLRDVLPLKPDIVLLDNMSPLQLSDAVAMRDDVAPEVELEASGGVSLATIAEIAAAGVDRISVGSLTHAAHSVDIGLDWGD